MRTQEASRRETRPTSSNSDQKEATTKDAKGKTVESAIPTGIQESSEDSSFAHQKEAKAIEIDGRDSIYSVAFLVDGKHVVGSGLGGKIRRWRVEDGREVGTPMDAERPVFNIAVSQDEKWVVSGTDSGLVTVWNAESYSKVSEWQAHSNWVRAVDVSPDGTRIVTGSRDKTVCVWSLSSGERLLGPFKHFNTMAAVKFSPNGRLIATATWNHDVRVRDNQSGRLLVEFPVKVYSFLNQSLAWASDNKQLFVLSRDSNIHCLDVSTGTTLSQWPINNSKDAQCIALGINGTFILVSTLSSVSFWDTTTHKQIKCVIHDTPSTMAMAISSNYDIVTAGANKITVHSLRDVLPSPYCDDVSAFASNLHCVKWLPNDKLLFFDCDRGSVRWKSPA
jgi:WD40 repeat protein